jgi:anti-anti-sigma factor
MRGGGVNRLPQLSFTWSGPTGGTGSVAVAGDLVHVNATDFLRIVTDELSANPELRELRVDCTELEICDSMGLSVLLMLRRRVDALDVALRVLNRPYSLDRMLELTGTFEYLTGVTTAGSRHEGEPSG